MQIKKASRRIGYILATFLFLFSSSSSAIYATGLSQEQRDAIGSGAYYFNTSEDDCSPGSSGSAAADISTVTPGSGAPDGGTFPNLSPASMASAIDAWILQKNPSSTLKGLGATMVASAKHANINPFILAAIPMKESGLGTPSGFNVSHGFNAYGRTATASQPNFQGDRLWYKWTSAKASVDYLAPENQGIKGGGDMATYLSVQFPDAIKSSDLVGLMNAYAPPFENDTSGYIANLRTWISELVTMAGGTPTPGANPGTTTPTSGGSACGACTATGSTSVNADTIVLDPGHSPTTSDTDQDATTGLYTLDYPNADGPEMPDAFTAATKIKAKLEAKGYKTVLTKSSVNDTINLSQRAQRANATNGALLVTLHSNTSGDDWMAYPDQNSVRAPGPNPDPNMRVDKKLGLVHPDIEAPSKKYADVMAPIVAKGLDKSYVSKSFADQYHQNGLLGNGKNYGNTPVQTILSSIPEVYSEVDRALLPTDQFAEAMTQAIMAAVPLSGVNTAASGGDSACGAVLGNVVQTAINYAWEDGRTTTTQKPTYASATQAAIAAGKYTGGLSIRGDDCGGFITRVMQNSGADPEYGGGGYTVTQENHMKEHPELYSLIHPASTADLQPGDIAINEDHTYMYVGKQPGFATVVASSSLEYGNVPPRAPTAGGETPADPSFRWYRFIK